MSYYTTFKTYTEVKEFLKDVDDPKCFTVNYKPDEQEYALWVGNQPYYEYEKWIEEEERKVKELKKENKKLEEIISQLRWTMLSKIFKIKQLEKEIDKAIYNLANEDISDEFVVDQIRMDLVKLLKDEKEEKQLEQNKITAETFLKGLENYADSCSSCKFFDPSKEYCKEHQSTVYNHTPKCDKWRYFA
jgi:predicted RNase H-like nuclease (RuvC/YqgF family)